LTPTPRATLTETANPTDTAWFFPTSTEGAAATATTSGAAARGALTGGVLGRAAWSAAIIVLLGLCM
jgi:hypothetical protein